MLRRRSLLSAVAGLATAPGLFPSPALAAAVHGVAPDRILFGQAAALEGPAAGLGRGVREGIATAFAEVNRGGGARGRTLDLVSYDDGYEPARSVEITRRLIEHDRVFALVGPVGTPTCEATQPVAAAAGVPFIGAFTGAAFLRNPHLHNVVNLRASYAQETEVIVTRLTEDLQAARFAIFHQNDAFGRAGMDGLKQALARRGLHPVALGAYERNTTNVRDALRTIQRAQPDAVVMATAYQPCAEFIRIARQRRMEATFASLSFVGGDALARELGPAGAGIVLTQVVPFPRDASLPLVRRYQDALRTMHPSATPGFASLEGYLVGRLVAAALDRVAGEPTRRTFLEALGGAFDLDGVRLAFGPGRNQGSDDVFLTVIQADGGSRPVTKLADVRQDRTR